jgi:hypothetical protein
MTSLPDPSEPAQAIKARVATVANKIGSGLPTTRPIRTRTATTAPPGQAVRRPPHPRPRPRLLLPGFHEAELSAVRRISADLSGGPFYGVRCG